jgi:Fe-S cluster assembly scaffold protein SufB
MKQLVEFVVGQQYENRKGVYEVLEIQGEAMRIRWDNGVEVDTTVDLQSRIIGGMKNDAEQLTRGKVVTQPIKGVASKQPKN